MEEVKFCAVTIRIISDFTIQNRAQIRPKTGIK